LIQIIGRAARNPKGEVILYADVMTESMVKSLRETYRRRGIQETFNTEHDQAFDGLQTKGKTKRLKRMTKKEQEMIAVDLKKQLDAAIEAWDFETAAVVRDQLKELRGD
jgi:excinuclease ABC subunit B